MAASFTKSDVTRALKGAKDAGEKVARFKITKDGNRCIFEIDTGKPQEDDAATVWDKATEELSKR